MKCMQQDATHLGLSVVELLPSHGKRHQQKWLSAVGSYSVRMLGVVSSFLRLVKALSCVGVQSQAFFGTQQLLQWFG